MITTPMTQPLQMPIEAFAERAYLEYAMYVVLDRALPHIADGLKPVQRRIVYAMRELGLQSGSKFKKSARTVGDVLGKFHPHGDQACYEAMVLLAQDFASRYPLLEGQGNWGSIDDPKSFAAMRYTEARLSPYASLLIDELRLGATDWINNFDGTVQEPQLLPARLPNILLNGASGIAVGMATDIPPHNLREVVDACICLLDNPGATTEALMDFVPAPDYPGGGVIVTSAADRLSLYESGNGSIKLRARYHVEDDTVVVTELPYQSSAGRICEQIAAQVEAKKLPWIDDIRDESDQDERVRLVMVLRSRRVDVDALMLHLFATTDLERSHRVQMNVINRTRRPEVMGLKLLLNEWLAYRRDTVTRRLRHRLAAIEERLHLLDGLLVVYAHIDAVIAVIRGEDHPREALMQTFSLTEQQAEAILAIRLRQLAKLEEIKLREEAAALGSEGSDIEAILASPARLTALLRDEMRADAAVYGDERRSECVADAPAAAPVAALTTAMRAEAATVVLSRNGWIRVAKGEVDGASLSYKTNDACGWSVVTMTDRDVLCFDNTGRAYTLPVQRLPGARGYGEPISKYIDLPAGAELRALTAVTDNSHIVLLSDSGYGFVVEGHECVGRTKTGKVVMKPADDDSLRFADMLSADEAHEWYVAILSSDGRLLLVSLMALPVLARGKGSRLIRLTDGATVAAMVVCGEDDTLSLHTSRKQHLLSPAHWQGFIGKRAGRGKPLPRGMTTATQLTRQPRTGDTANE